MFDMLLNLFELGFGIWNSFLETAMGLFIVDPLNSDKTGAVAALLFRLSTTLINLAVPLCTVFFLIALVRDILVTPTQHQMKHILKQGIKYVILITLMSNLWTLMSGISQVCTGVATSFSNTIGDGYQLSLTADSDLQEAVNNYEFEIEAGFMDVGGFLKEFFMKAIGLLTVFICGIGCVGVGIFCGLSIINEAWKRLIQPIIILPFTSIAIAAGAGTPEVSRSMVSFIKTFIGFCLSGAVMIAAVYIAGEVTRNGIIDVSSLSIDTPELRIALAAIIQMIVPIFTAGLVKGSNQLISKALAL